MASAQSGRGGEISGTVFDSNGEPVVGAAIIVEGTTSGTSTDANGHFSIKAAPNATLAVTCIGYKGIQVPVGNRTNIQITLNEDTTSIEDVVIVAYGTASKASLTGSVSQVNSSEIEKRTMTSVTSALEGAAPGIMVNDTYGEPGTSPSVRIRGFGSVNGTNSPLYVLDGMPFGGNISDLNPADIESVSVLKDAASSALYGNRAANGVILITTKQGRKDKVSVNFNMKQGVYQRGISDYETLGANDWMETMWTGAKNLAISSLGYDEADALTYVKNNIIQTHIKNNIYNKADTELFDSNGKLVAGAAILPGYDDLDWWDEIERLGHRQEYTISADVAGDKFSAFMSAGYLGEKGYVVTSDFKRFSGRANLSYKPTKWFRVGMNLSATSQESNSMGSASGSYYANPFYSARYMAPVYPVYEHNADGSKVLDDTGNPVYNSSSVYLNSRNVVWENLLNHDTAYRQTMAFQPYITISFLKDFQFTMKGDLNVRSSRSESYDNPTIGDGSGANGRLYHYFYRYKNYTFQQQLTWGHDFDKHHVDALLAHESYKYMYDYEATAKTDMALPGVIVMSNFNTLSSISGYDATYTTESYLGRVRYNYDEKYFAEASFRRDGSSRFHPNNRWGNFWSLGGSWMISREDFMKNVSWVNDLKFRAAYGEVGNDAGVGYYAYKSLYSSDTNHGMGAYYKSQNEASDIQWETTATFDVALEGRLWDRVNFSFDYFDKRSKDLLFDVTLPQSSGATSTSGADATVTKNIGSVSNKGLEVAIDVDAIRRKDWRWNIGLNLTWLRNRIITLPNHEDIANGTKRYSEGHSIYEFYTYQFVGVDQMTGNSLYKIDDAYNIDLLGTDDTAGTSATADTQKWDVVINGQRYTRNTTYASKDWSGSALPTVYGSVSTSLSWKNLTLSALFTYSIGGKVYDSSYATLMRLSTSSGSAIHKDILKSWSGIPEGMTETSANRIDPNGTPVIDMYLSTYNNATSNRWLQDASYLVIKNISLSYEFPKRLVSKIGLQGLSLNLGVENAATFTAIKGMNPQYSFTGSSDDTFVTARVYTLGLSIKL